MFGFSFAKRGRKIVTLAEIVAKAKAEGKNVDTTSIAFTLGFLAAAAPKISAAGESAATSSPTTKVKSENPATRVRPWGEPEKAAWLANTKVHRLYKDEVLSKLEAFKVDKDLDVVQYGALKYIDEGRFPLFAIKSKNWDAAAKPSVLVTGGVHGYETSGVQGAIVFVKTQLKKYAEHFNIVVAPCVSPWGYERIERWNANAEDPNRGFDRSGSSREECAAVQKLVQMLGGPGTFLMHVDLHETTDTDDTKFRPTKAARDGEKFDLEKEGGIPDGFYLVGDSGALEKNVPKLQDWLTAMIDSVSKVTHIAPPDDNGEIIGAKVQQEGVIYYPAHDLFLCSSVTDARYAVTTEVYPDSVKATDAQCNDAQVACVVGALDFLIKNKLK